MAQNLSELASRLLSHIRSKGKAPVQGLARDLGALPKDVEDALGWLVRSEYLGKDFKLVDWNYSSYKKSRSRKPKPAQALLFGAPSLLDKRSRKRTIGQQADYAQDTHNEKPLFVERLTTTTTKDVMVKLVGMSADKWMRESADSLETGGWEIKSWKEYKAIGLSPAHLIVTLVKEIVIFNESQEATGATQAQGTQKFKAWQPWRGSNGQSTRQKQHKIH